MTGKHEASDSPAAEPWNQLARASAINATVKSADWPRDATESVITSGAEAGLLYSACACSDGAHADPAHRWTRVREAAALVACPIPGAHLVSKASEATVIVGRIELVATGSPFRGLRAAS